MKYMLSPTRFIRFRLSAFVQIQFLHVQLLIEYKRYVYHDNIRLYNLLAYASDLNYYIAMVKLDKTISIGL